MNINLGHIQTISVTKDYKIHGMHNRSLDNKDLLSSFSKENFKNTDNDNNPIVWVILQSSYDKWWTPPKIINISKISQQDSSQYEYHIAGVLTDITWIYNGDTDFHLEGVLHTLGKNTDSCISLQNILRENKDKVYFEHIADEDLNISYIRLYILVNLEGFSGYFKYYL